jgi:hypothetical protein
VNIGARVRQARERKPWRFYGNRSLWEARIGDAIIGTQSGRYPGIRATVVYPFAHPTEDGPGITVSMRDWHGRSVVNANDFRPANALWDGER